MSLIPPARLPILLTGTAGVVGYNALPTLWRHSQGQVVAVRPSITEKLQGPGVVACNLEDADQVRRLFQQHRFQTVLHGGGNCALKSCELDPAMAQRVNVESVVNLLDCLNDDARLVHLSSDLVYSGMQGGNLTEDVPPDPVTVYGKTMAAAETIVLSRRPDAAVLRISLPMGPSFNHHAGAIDWIDSRFRNHRPATLYFDEVRTPTYTNDLTAVLRWLIDHPISGLFHAGGPRAMTLHQIGQVVNRAGNYPPALLHGCPRRHAGPMPPRAGDVTMNSRKLTALLPVGMLRPWPADDHCVPDHPDWHQDRQPRPFHADETLRRLALHSGVDGARTIST